MPDYTDPPNMPEDERMTPAELKVVREFLGLSGAALGVRLDVSDRTIRHWEEGKYPIPDGVRLAVERLEAMTGELVSELIDKLMDAPDPVLVTFRSDEECPTIHGITLPASWHRAVAARVAQEVPGLSITYLD